MRCLELDLLKLSLDLSVSVLLINCELLFHALVWFHLVTISLSSFGIDLFKGFKFLQEKDIGCLCCLIVLGSSFCRVQFSGVGKADKGARQSSTIQTQEDTAFGRGM
jgi:hypothetical protein